MILILDTNFEKFVHVLPIGDPRVMYMICGYEMAILGFSPWCELFDPEDFEVLEYLSDLKVPSVHG